MMITAGKTIDLNLNLMQMAFFANKMRKLLPIKTADFKKPFEIARSNNKAPTL